MIVKSGAVMNELFADLKAYDSFTIKILYSSFIEFWIKNIRLIKTYPGKRNNKKYINICGMYFHRNKLNNTNNMNCLIFFVDKCVTDCLESVSFEIINRIGFR